MCSNCDWDYETEDDTVDMNRKRIYSDREGPFPPVVFPEQKERLPLLTEDEIIRRVDAHEDLDRIRQAAVRQYNYTEYTHRLVVAFWGVIFSMGAIGAVIGIIALIYWLVRAVVG